MKQIKNFDKLETLRGQVAVQAHLLKAEIKDRFNALEDDWNKLTAQLKKAKETADEASEEVEAARELLVDTLRDGYQKIWNTFRSN